MRGEKDTSDNSTSAPMGSPPRARGKDNVADGTVKRIGITPACAGKSALMDARMAFRRDHPRVRGEKFTFSFIKRFAQGSPPRARGKAGRQYPFERLAGITPACAGKS